jgi:hypothetical protein
MGQRVCYRRGKSTHAQAKKNQESPYFCHLSDNYRWYMAAIKQCKGQNGVYFSAC